MFNLHTKFEVFTINCSEEMKGNAQRATENAGVENAIRSKLQGRKIREWK